MRKIVAALAIVMGLMVAGSAQAQMVTAKSPATIVSALQDAGYRAELSKDSVGDPLIRSASSGSRFTITFYGCTDGADCSSVQFYAGWTEATHCSLEAMNTFAQKYRFVTPQVDDDKDCVIQYDLDLDKGGMSKELFLDTLEFWTDTMATFKDYIYQE
ncbi:putative sensory transduction regulator [Novosphingobium sp. PhB165]|uniref:YbjN domain-containing protein n=1 Tax=Novosphingobium sp. PhB165 TaxID=2485105 RepID=UPI001043F469|nr:YbjN domain-containing protein [Novosphingobium sp. PhB165]TCM21963.1 putative sensory transduction regulator [Novosphingobium sp. PhB165]